MSEVPSRALRETLRDQLGPPPPGSSCLDAETLAAWSEGALGRHDRAIVETHASTCARCQALLAAMAKTSPPMPARRWWQMSAVRWLVPVAATAGLAVAVWVKLPAGRPVAPAATAAVPAAASETPPPAAEVAAPAEVAGALERADAKRDERRTPEPDRPRTPATAAADALEPQQTVPSSAKEAPAAAPAAAARDEAAPAPAPPPAAFRSTVPRELAETATLAPRASLAAARALIEIPSPDRNVRWRIAAGRTVERSIDGGATWRAQSTGAVPVTAGAAPSATLCWLVGPAGVVLVTRDGLTWQRVAFPDAVDLIAIRATDSSSATVTTAGGRTFTTTDGGATWR